MFIVYNGDVIPFDGKNIPDTVAGLLCDYGQEWVVVDATDEVDALSQADLFDAGRHPANTEMTLFAVTFTSMYKNDEEAALAWAGWEISLGK
ncbi:MAG TPA: hypothetical protein DIW31_06130 [Bacteroidales bacterium]|nr:hypothetical protein [Bacteroidales bacterium]